MGDYDIQQVVKLIAHLKRRETIYKMKKEELEEKEGDWYAKGLYEGILSGYEQTMDYIELYLGHIVNKS